MYNERARNLEGVFLTLDAACILAGFGLAILLRVFHESIPGLRAIPSIPWESQAFVRSDYAVLFLANLSAWLIYLRKTRFYVRGEFDDINRVLVVYLKALLLCIFATSAATFAFKVSVSRLLFGYLYVLQFALLFAKQLAVISVSRRIRSDELNRRHALVIGPRTPGSWLCDIISGAHATGHSLVGLLVIDDETERQTANPNVIGSIRDLDKVLYDNPVDDVFIIGSARELSEMAPIAQKLIERGRIVSLVSTLSGGKNGVRGRVTEFNGVPMISFGPMPTDEVQSGTQRFIDIAGSGLALLLLSPLMLLVAAAIKIFDSGPVLFRQERLGLGGRTFTLLKFRSMRSDAEQILAADPELHRQYIANDFKLPPHQDPRISRLGRFLRKSSIDELPQFWNVLRGEMTMVGPRPIVPKEISQYEPYVDLLFSARPGLTGPWQVSGRNQIRYPERAFLDLDYVSSHSVSEDLSIALRTLPAVIRGRGVQ